MSTEQHGWLNPYYHRLLPFTCQPGSEWTSLSLQTLTLCVHRGGRVLRFLPSIMPQLLPLLAEPQPDVRHAAALCLGALGARAAAILPSLPPPPPSAATVPPSPAFTPASAAAHAALSFAPPPPTFRTHSQLPPPQFPPPPPPPPGGGSGRAPQFHRPPPAPPGRGTVAPKPPPPLSDASATLFQWCLEALSRGLGPGATPRSALPPQILVGGCHGDAMLAMSGVGRMFLVGRG